MHVPCTWCPRSTANALKVLRGRDSGSWDAKARQEISAVFDRGVQVEWMSFSTFLEWVIYLQARWVCGSGTTKL